MPRLHCLFAPVLLLCATATTASAAAPAGPIRPDVPSVEPGSCPRPDYPPEARSHSEQGITTLAVQVGADGAVRRIDLVGASGSVALDTAAQESLARCRFKPAVVHGQAVERWRLLQYVWEFENDHPMSKLTWLLDVAAAQGRPAAQYALYNMISREAASAKPGQNAPSTAHLPVLLRHAAAGGHCLAKHMLGELYEDGSVVKQDLRQARDWYEQAAACGNPVAADKLTYLPPAR